MKTDIHPGDIVEVKTADEILSTLDADGTMGQLPFMPEMVEFCGRRFRVSRRVLKICVSGSGPSTMRKLTAGDLIVLEGLRCSGASHDGCQKECALLWREAWVRKIAGEPRPENPQTADGNLRARLRTASAGGRYFCQASELLKYTAPLPRSDRFKVCWQDVRARNCSATQMVHRVSTWLYWRLRRKLLGEFARGTHRQTPTSGLELRVGEPVVVKSRREIVETTDPLARNRGLYFSPDMSLLCTRPAQVRHRIDKIIVDGTGEMRQLRDTVYLEGSMCGCAHVAFGGCPRGEFAYWREIWLRRRKEP